MDEWHDYYLILNSRKSSVVFIDVWADFHGTLALLTTFVTVNWSILEPGEDLSPYLCVSDSFLGILFSRSALMSWRVHVGFFLKVLLGYFWAIANKA